ncbi:unnamed protein product, partial [Polarella glacialis]
MGGAPSRAYQDGEYVMIDMSRSMKFDASIRFGKVIACCAGIERHSWEYTVLIDDDDVECVPEQHLRILEADPYLSALPWLTPSCREVAVWVETHQKKKFVAELLTRDKDGLFEVMFVSDGSILEKIQAEHLSKPDLREALRTGSPNTVAPDPKWLLDRKVQAGIDVFWPIQLRMKAALEQL